MNHREGGLQKGKIAVPKFLRPPSRQGKKNPSTPLHTLLKDGNLLYPPFSMAKTSSYPNTFCAAPFSITKTFSALIRNKDKVEEKKCKVVLHEMCRCMLNNEDKLFFYIKMFSACYCNKNVIKTDLLTVETLIIRDCC